MSRLVISHQEALLSTRLAAAGGVDVGETSKAFVQSQEVKSACLGLENCFTSPNQPNLVRSLPLSVLVIKKASS